LNYKLVFATIIIFIIICVIPVSSVATGELIWSQNFNDPSNAVNTIDTTQDGNVVFAGLTNGTILAYSAAGVLQWQLDLNGSITKLITISDGSRIVVMNNQNQTYWIDGIGGTLITTVFNQSFDSNITDIGISRLGDYFAVSGMSHLSIYDSNGSIYVTNNTFGPENWSKIAFDPYSKWLVATNGLNKAFKWNVTNYTGWPEMNFFKETRNQSNIRDDGFPYKYTFTTVLIDEGNNLDFPLSFVENTSPGADIYPGIVHYNNNFWFNFSICGNLTIRDNVTLNNVISQSNTNIPPYIVNYTILHGYRDINIYYGNLSYKSPTYGNGSIP
jgi:hypothetical protein